LQVELNNSERKIIGSSGFTFEVAEIVRLPGTALPGATLSGATLVCPGRG